MNDALMAHKRMGNEVRALVRATTSPVVFHPGGWADSLPAEVKARVVPSRLEALLNGGWDRATEHEVMCYLFTASLVSPMTHDWAQVYAYVTGLWRPDAKEDVGAPDELSVDEDRLLGELQREIWEGLQRRKESFMPERVKVVLDIEPSLVRVGIGAEGCDPVIRPLEGDLAMALGQLPAMVDAAKEQWEASPRNPKHVKPRASRAKKDSADPPADAAAAQAAPEAPAAEPPADAAATEMSPSQKAVADEVIADARVDTAAASELPLLEDAPKDAELEDPPGVPEAELAAAERAARVTEAAEAEPIVGGVTMFQCPKCTFQAYSEEALGEHDEHTHPEAPESELSAGAIGDFSPPVEVSGGASPEAPEAPQAAAETAQAPEPAEAPATPEPVADGKYVIIATGKTHDTVHAALLDLGESQETINGKQYWHRLDRLPKRLAEQIRKKE